MPIERRCWQSFWVTSMLVTDDSSVLVTGQDPNMLSKKYDFPNMIPYREPIDNWRFILSYDFTDRFFLTAFKRHSNIKIKDSTWNTKNSHFHFNKSKITLKCLKCREYHSMIGVPIRYLVFASNQRKYAHLEKKWIIMSDWIHSAPWLYSW